MIVPAILEGVNQILNYVILEGVNQILNYVSPVQSYSDKYFY